MNARPGELSLLCRGDVIMSLSAAARILRAVDRLIKMVISLVKSWQIIQSQLAVSSLDLAALARDSDEKREKLA